MIIHIDKEGSLRNLEKMLQETSANPEVKSILILACDSNGFTPAIADNLLKASSKPVFGGIFPELLTESEKLSKGTIIAGLPTRINTLLLRNISDPNVDVDELFAKEFQGSLPVDGTIFLFVDGMSKTIAPLLDSAFSHLGLRSNYIGGGAGSATFRPIPCIITSEGILQDAALFVFSDLVSGVGVAHGWHPVSKTLKVTEASYNSVISLDWKPAIDVYKEIVGEVISSDPGSVEFAKISNSFPIGIVKMADELLVRDPVRCDGNSLICLGEMPLNSFIYILKGDVDSLLAGTLKSRQLADRIFNLKPNIKKSPPIVFFIDCITRAGFLGDRFNEELSIAAKGNKLIGALSLGEISNSGSDYLEFYNKTCVVGLVEN
jgi:hypothetical protein